MLADVNMRYNESKKKFMIRNKINQLSEFQENVAVKKGEILDRDKDMFFNALIAKYGYSLTAHKAQGGEWDNVMVDMSTGHRDNTLESLRWKYTAVTRAKNKLFLINSALSESEFKPNLRTGNAYSPWDERDDEILSLYYELKKPISEISAKMKRSEGSIRSRLSKLGLE